MPTDAGPKATPGPESVDGTGLAVLPDFDTFRRLAEDYEVVPVWCELLGDLETPVSAFQKLRGPRSFLLESVERGEHWGRFSFIGTDPEFVLSSEDGKVKVEGAGPSDLAGLNDPLEAIERLLGRCRTPELHGLPPLHAGLVGYWGYETVAWMERVPISNQRALSVPDMLLFATGTVVAFDHFRQRLVAVRNVWLEPGHSGDRASLGAAYDDALDRLHGVREALARPYAEKPVSLRIPEEPPEPECNMTPETYMGMVERAKEYIRAGDVFQVVLSRRFSRPITGDPFDVHRTLRLVNPSPYMTYLEHPEATIVSASPEELVRLRDGRVLTRPIAGTRWRGSTADEDRRLGDDLLADPKERAEHVMLVDLARNDLGRVGEYGSVTVDDFMTVERYSHVMHLVSTVECDARSQVGPMDVLRATFPAGTVSGAPKVRAMEIIDELEPDRRGPYAGVVGYVDFCGNLDTAITLRTAVVKDGIATVQAGGGIVADSDPVYELNESANKARAVLVAIEAAERMMAGSEE